MLFHLAKNRELLGEINVKSCIIEKSKKTDSKNCKFIFSGTVEKNCSRHTSMPKNVVHYLNIKFPDILVDIIDLQLCSSLKWDDV